MESAWIAEAALDRPVAVLRVVVDTADRRLANVWPAVKKALRLYLLGVETADEAAQTMQRLASSEAP